MSGQFLPFRPPPLPQPESAKATAASTGTTKTGEQHAMEEDSQQDVQTRVYKAVFTIEETTDGNGEVKIVAHSPELIEEPESGSDSSASAGPVEPQTFLERMALRQLRYEEARRPRNTMLAISVKRQRKLKMKKKKYKKLTKRLRHERLKHGRT
ncbi:hypothetical protein M406DRAFT_356534 [Cryphonectria parasitica EP155]|uniref:Ribosomal protein mS38 C-terminal domain-containing protein n=1 Tax=Cryphonectria parasitica (strain ATCC 38755 / EP155) TaxID=660469 RepID=A0A9P4Y0P3_CRYP1|nr:uncharacterized protein M406DRAFT_356534 [Cryphonectria parasitica EP155]KAF3764396.1 hypothetical protein M406DRAFT_356534 [Cryphonectria parasitica EP155]